MTHDQFEKLLIKLDAVLLMMQDIYDVMLQEATKVEKKDKGEDE